MKAALVQATFAPFHLSRLDRALIERRPDDDAIGIEIASSQSDYFWSERHPAGRVKTLFPGRDYWSISARDLARALFVELDEGDADVVVLPGWGFKESFVGLSWSLQRGRAAVVISDSAPAGKDLVRRLTRRWVISNFDAAFVGGSIHEQFMRSMGMPAGRVFKGCDVVDNDFFTAAATRTRARRATGPVVLASVTRLIGVKNIPAVLRVLASTAPEWEWIIAGEGPERANIEREIEALGLTNRVRLLGTVKYEDLPAVYASADVYLQPSLSDTWGLAVNEAMASGLPVIVSSGAGCSNDLVRQGINGFVFDPRSPTDLADVLRQMTTIRTRWPEMGAASTEIIGDWGLSRFASGFWDACAAAVEHRGQARRVAGPQLGRLLAWIANFRWRGT